MMVNVTLDTNCIIDIEEDREDAIYLKQLCKWHCNKINLRVVAISISERLPGGRIAKTFKEYKERLKNIGLGNIEILKPMANFSLSFWDWCVYGDGMESFDKQLHGILFPDIEFGYKEHCLKNNISPFESSIDWQWLNAKSAVQLILSHIHNGGGIFVTSDSNFHKVSKKECLIPLGAGDILTPKEALDKVACLI